MHKLEQSSHTIKSKYIEDFMENNNKQDTNIAAKSKAAMTFSALSILKFQAAKI